MSHAQVGACPMCGAPIYSPLAWSGVCPPPVQYSCDCKLSAPYHQESTGTAPLSRQDELEPTTAARSAERPAKRLFSRWRRIHRRSQSGRVLYVCLCCGRTSATPDVACPGPHGCPTWRPSVEEGMEVPPSEGG